MHACGHDAHTAILLATARILMRHRDELPGTIVFCFQPAEEGRGGARKMIADGRPGEPACGRRDRPPCHPGLAARHDHRLPRPDDGGRRCLHGEDPGQGRARRDAARHGGCPDGRRRVRQRLADAGQPRGRAALPGGVTTATLHAGGTAANIIADTATFSGTTRWFDQETGDILAERFPALVTSVAEGMRATAEVEIRRVVPPTVNEPRMADLVRAVATEVVGAEQGADRAAHDGRRGLLGVHALVPSCFFCVGSRDEASGKVWGHHHPKFDIDERCLVHRRRDDGAHGDALSGAGRRLIAPTA